MNLIQYRCTKLYRRHTETNMKTSVMDGSLLHIKMVLRWFMIQQTSLVNRLTITNYTWSAGMTRNEKRVDWKMTKHRTAQESCNVSKPKHLSEIPDDKALNSNQPRETSNIYPVYPKGSRILTMRQKMQREYKLLMTHEWLLCCSTCTRCISTNKCWIQKPWSNHIIQVQSIIQ